MDKKIDSFKLLILLHTSGLVNVTMYVSKSWSKYYVVKSYEHFH